jgi:hypothetical protein
MFATPSIEPFVGLFRERLKARAADEADDYQS